MPLTNRIRSFVRRDSRITPAQKLALAHEWDRFALAPGIDSVELSNTFPRGVPINLEIGAGDGACILSLALANPAEDFVAVEVYRPGLGRLLIRAAAACVDNLRVCDVDVCDLIARIDIPMFDRVFIFFPDPWPKKRHHKRRLLQREFFEMLAPRIHRHGRVFVATDCETYAQSIMQVFANLPGWINLAGVGRTAPRPHFRVQTKFERKALAAGATVFEFIFARLHEPVEPGN